MAAFEFNYKVTGNDRKRLVSAIGEILEVPPKYLGAPTFAYEVDYITIDKNGNVETEEVDKESGKPVDPTGATRGTVGTGAGGGTGN